MKTYSEQRYGVEVNVLVVTSTQAWVDGIKGMNLGHALWRARQNWTDAEIFALDGEVN